MVTFRWAIWNATPRGAQLLAYSIGTFRRAFGRNANYVVFTDRPDALRQVIGLFAEVRAFDSHPNRCFDIDARAPWRKWCPTARLFLGEPEIYVDSDVFLVGDPVELRAFCSSSPEDPPRYLCLQESHPTKRMFGQLDARVPVEAPAINAGLIGQSATADFGPALAREYVWWREHVQGRNETHHDEQGAVAAALALEAARGRLELLPPDRYCAVSPRTNPDLHDTKGRVLIHATFPGHPAFERFLPAILAYQTSRHDSSNTS